MTAMINPPTIEALREQSMKLPDNRKLDGSELAERYFKVCKEAKDLWERWMITESDAVFREWQFAAKQAAQLKVTINNRLHPEVDINVEGF